MCKIFSVPCGSALYKSHCINNTQQSTAFRNQTPECSPFYYYYTALHVSAYRQAIIRCYLTLLSIVILTC
jgi:hypothetical protein